jgi:DNA-binding CsgD family transcriptional regulator
MAARVLRLEGNRLVVRCIEKGCQLVQFQTESGNCRKCGSPYEEADPATVAAVETLRNDPIQLCSRIPVFSKTAITRHETMLLGMVADGMATREISKVLGTTDQCVKNAVHKINAKLGTHDRAHAVATAFRLGIISLESAPALPDIHGGIGTFNSDAGGVPVVQ